MLNRSRIATWTVCLILAVQLLHGQSRDRIVVLSSRVGESIDSLVREDYHLFPTIEHFSFAEFYQTSDQSYYVRIFFFRSNELTDTIVSCSAQLVLMIAEKLNHYEDLMSGAYTMGTDPARLQYIEDTLKVNAKALQEDRMLRADRVVIKDSGTILEHRQLEGRRSAAVSTSGDFFPWSSNVPDEAVEHYPRLGFGFAYAAGSPNIAGLNQAFTLVEDRYRRQGYNIRPHRQFAAGEIRWFSLKYMFSAAVAAALEAGSSTEDLDVRSATIAIIIHFDLFRSRFVKPYLAVGAGIYHLASFQSYGYGNRISPIDTSGRYQYLADIRSSDGGGGVFPLTVGVELIASGGPSLSLYATDFAMSARSISLSTGDHVELNPSYFAIGARAMIYF